MQYNNLIVQTIRVVVLVFQRCYTFFLAAFNAFRVCCICYLLLWVDLFLFGLLSSCFLIGAVYFVKWGILNWLEWDWTISNENQVQLFQGVYLVLTLWLTGIVCVHIFCRAVMARSLYTEQAMILAGDQLQRSESQPLITSQVDPIKSSEFSVSIRILPTIQCGSLSVQGYFGRTDSIWFLRLRLNAYVDITLYAVRLRSMQTFIVNHRWNIFNLQKYNENMKRHRTKWWNIRRCCCSLSCFSPFLCGLIVSTLLIGTYSVLHIVFPLFSCWYYILSSQLMLYAPFVYT